MSQQMSHLVFNVFGLQGWGRLGEKQFLASGLLNRPKSLKIVVQNFYHFYMGVRNCYNLTNTNDFNMM